MKAGKVSEVEIAELSAIYYELATKYGIDIPFPREQAIASILKNRPERRQSLRWMKKMGMALGQRINSDMVKVINGKASESANPE